MVRRRLVLKCTDDRPALRTTAFLYLEHESGKGLHCEVEMLVVLFNPRWIDCGL